MWPFMLLARALALPVWVAIPMIQVILGVFPWTVNRWFGFTAAIYYGIATPLLFQVEWLPARSDILRMLMRALCASCCALTKALAYDT